jgi:hypothetical protein
LLFAEHWETNENLKLINIKNFELSSYFCRVKHIHGGTAIYVKNDVTVNNRDDLLNLNVELDFELSAVEIVESETVYCCIYRSPNGNIDTFFLAI